MATSLLLATAMPATAGHYGGGGDTNWGAVAGAGILGALLGAATVPQQQPQIIVVVPSQPSYVAPQPAPRISDREFLEHYVPPTLLGALLGAATVPQQQPQIIVVVPSQPSYVAPQPAPRISDREFLEHYVPPTPAATVQHMRWWCPTTRRWFPDVSDCAVPWSGLVETIGR